jgi:CDP-4-dehydro-6-deoxyglucose reductase
MGHRVKVQGTGLSFEVQPKETLLDAGLRAGLNLPYNCGTGTCGGCRIRVVSGEVAETPFDFRFTEAERAAGWVLPCRAETCSDLEIEARLLETAADVPEQRVLAKVSRVELLQPGMIQLAVRTPRTQTLQFLAGQRVSLGFAGLPARELSLASCPCDGMHLRFQIRRDDADPFAAFVFQRLRRGDRVELTGPMGRFLLHDESPRKRLFVAWESGFAPVSSIIDHALALDPDRTMHLYWLSAIPEGHYLSNYCRTWVDALDDFHYHSVDLAPWGEQTLEAALEGVLRDRPDLIDYDVYAALPEAVLEPARQRFMAQGLPPSQWRGEAVPRP